MLEKLREAVGAARRVMAGEVVVDRSDEYKEKADRLFGVLQLMEQDRNRWKELFFTQAREHVAAQAMLESALERTGRICERLVVVVNKHRSEKGLELVPMRDYFKQEELEFSKRYADKLRAAVAAMPASPDAKT